MDGKFFNLSNLFNESLRLITHCPVCKVRYSSNQAKVIEERPDYNLVHITCQNCSKSILAIVMTGSLGVNSVGMVTDLSSDDVLRLRDADPVNADDVLAVHQLIEKQPTVLDQL